MLSKIEEIKAEVEAGKEPTTTVRELLRWFEARRRRTGVVDRIQSELSEAGVITFPDFNTVWIDSEISFRKLPAAAADGADRAAAAAEGELTEDGGGADEAEPKDAAFLIGMLEAANRGIVSVQPQDTIEKAITLMLAHDYSQLAVMISEREVKGVISWKTIGKRLSQKNSLNEVKDAVEEAHVLADNAPLFQATRKIVDEEFVFIKSSADRKISGIVTATDLSEQFQLLSEPFLLLGQIENQIRKLLHGIFDKEALRDACNENDPERKEKIESISDLSFGEYIRILENPENWEKIGLNVDRVVFCSEMQKVRLIRNDVMHFDPDGIDEDQYDQLRRFSHLLDELDELSRGSAH